LSAIPSPISAFVRDATQPYLRYLAETRDLKGCALHDPLALALAFAPELVEVRPLYVDVGIGSGPCLGKTIADFYELEGEKPNVRVALAVKARGAVEMFLGRVERLCRGALGSEGFPRRR
jgi:purine nucleosidase